MKNLTKEQIKILSIIIAVVIVIVLAISIISLVKTIKNKKTVQEVSNLNDNIVEEELVIDENDTTEINIEDIVVGDIVYLQSGDRIPADGEIIEGEITVDESSITGETKEIYKNVLKKKEDVNKF